MKFDFVNWNKQSRKNVSYECHFKTDKLHWRRWMPAVRWRFRATTGLILYSVYLMKVSGGLGERPACSHFSEEGNNHDCDAEQPPQVPERGLIIQERECASRRPCGWRKYADNKPNFSARQCHPTVLKIKLLSVRSIFI